MIPRKGQSFWPTRIAWPRKAEDPAALIPALVAGPASAPGNVAYAGQSRFVLSPLSLSLDQVLLLIVTALLAFGLVMVQSADARVRGFNENWFLQSFQTKNAIHAALALGALVFFWRLDYRRFLGEPDRRWALLKSPATWLLVATVGCLAAVLVTPLGREINGARRWLALGPLGFQPSELAKIGLVLFVSAYAVHCADSIRSFFKGFVPLVAIFGITAVLVVKEDFGTTVLIASVVFVLMMMAGLRWWHLLLLLPPAAAAVYKMVFADPTSFRYRRFMAFLDPMHDPQGVGYHPLQSLLTIASGGFWGRGLGNGIQKMGYLPEDNTDFIFAVICEELGFFGAATIIGLFIALTLIGWRIMSRCQNPFGKMVAFGITAIIGLQACINVAVVTVTVPTKGIALPFVSSGGTGWLLNAIAVGILMSIERQNRRDAEHAEQTRAALAPTRGFPIEMKTQEPVNEPQMRRG